MHASRRKWALRGQTVGLVQLRDGSPACAANPCCVGSPRRAALAAPEGYELQAGRYQNEQDFREAVPELLRYARQ